MNRRQFLRSALAAAPLVVASAALAELLVPKRTIFLPPRGGWLETNTVVYGPHVHGADADIIALIQRRMNEAMRSLQPMIDDIAHQVYATSPQEWAAAANGLRGLLFSNEKKLPALKHYLIMGVPVVPDPAIAPGKFEFRSISRESEFGGVMKGACPSDPSISNQVAVTRGAAGESRVVRA